MGKQSCEMEDMVILNSLQEFYADKKVLITGHTGFKGAWLMATLDFLGAKTIGYALAPEHIEGVYNFIQHKKPGISIINDIRDKSKLEEVLIEYKPEIIFHLAAQPLVRVSYEKPAETFEVNVTGTANLLEAVTRLKNKCSVVVITTDKVYYNREEDVLYNEEDRLGGYDPYSASKACAELVVDSYRKSFFNPSDFGIHQKAVASVRAGNVIGGGDWGKDRIIPDIINSLRSSKSIVVRNPNAIRPWQHVLEAISGYLILAKHLHADPGKYSQAFNLGPMPGDHIPVKQLVQIAINVWGNGDWVDVSDKFNLHEAGLLKLDIKKALRELDWSPKLSADTAIKWTLDWYKIDDDKKADYTYKQIRQYFML